MEGWARIDTGDPWRQWIDTLCSQQEEQAMSPRLDGNRNRRSPPGEGRSQVLYVGTPASPGVAVGMLFAPASAASLEDVPDRAATDPDAELDALEAAMSAVHAELRDSGAEMATRLPDEVGTLYGVYEMILADPHLMEEAVRRIRGGQWAPAALCDTVQSMARNFEAMEDAYLRARAEDIRAVGRRILLRLLPRGSAPEIPLEQTVLLGKGLGLACITGIPSERLAGLVCTGGSTLSHGVIVARALGIPAVVGVEGLRLDQGDGREVILDGYRGRVILDPTPEVRAEFQRLQREETRLVEGFAAEYDLPARTLDGVPIALQANISLLSEIPRARERGAEGVGLFRTEFPFLLHDDIPDEDTQYNIYRELLETFAPHPVNIRTLDAGGDKPLPYLPQAESNPALGQRGIRLCLAHPEMFLSQLRALLRANAGLGNLRLMLPMVTLGAEIRETRELIDRAHRDLEIAGRPSMLPPVGIMVEVPAAVLRIDALAAQAAFVSIGTNDLTQYILAADRTNAALGSLCDPLTPAVLTAIGMAAEGAARQGIPVGVCGELAGDTLGALLLLGLGVDSLSLSAGGIPRVKHLIRAFSRGAARDLWKQALALDSAGGVRAMLTDVLEARWLGGLIRPGA
ncbi:MAG: phosphoenolpyruvate--protein phosphotransferase [Pseudomonadota bacterium]|nr:phosphoenolpyruvate--protein phosphotransferase [Pseudomonadota bacterium]